jgi:hypothetical protein
MRMEFGNVVRGSQQPKADIRLSLPPRLAAPPTQWWRIRSPHDLSSRDVRKIREALLRSDLVDDREWFRAVGGDAATAIGIAIKTLKSCGMRNPLTDAVVSAVLCCALDGDPAARVVMISALRRRAKIDPICHGLRLRWLHARL